MSFIEEVLKNADEDVHERKGVVKVEFKAQRQIEFEKDLEKVLEKIHRHIRVVDNN